MGGKKEKNPNRYLEKGIQTNNLLRSRQSRQNDRLHKLFRGTFPSTFCGLCRPTDAFLILKRAGESLPKSLI